LLNKRYNPLNYLLCKVGRQISFRIYPIGRITLSMNDLGYKTRRCYKYKYLMCYYQFEFRVGDY